MKKIFVTLMAVMVMFMASLAFAGPAAATGNDRPDADSKPVTLCHLEGNGSYHKITINVNGWYNGHRDHKDSGDIWKAFSYENKDGDVINVPAAGDTSLLEFDDCEAPKEPEKVTVTVNVVDKCATKDDVVTATASNPAVTNVQVDKKSATTYEVVAVLDNKVDFTFDLDNTWTVSPDGSRATKTVTLTDEDCDLPETGGAATYNTVLGGAALAGVILLAGAMVLTRKRS